MWEKHKPIKCPVDLKPMFKTLMEKNEKICQVANGNCGDESEQVLLWSEASFHTHPHGVPRPSGVDLDTARRTGRPLMCIGMVPSKKTVCWQVNANSIKKMCEF